MKRYSITGWWSQPHFPALKIVRGKVNIIGINNAHAFSGILVVHEDGRIDEESSMLLDKNGMAELKNGQFDISSGTITFDKFYLKRTDVISYTARYRSDRKCWDGKFDGNATGQGITMFAIQELPNGLFVFAEQ